MGTPNLCGAAQIGEPFCSSKTPQETVTRGERVRSRNAAVLASPRRVSPGNPAKYWRLTPIPSRLQALQDRKRVVEPRALSHPREVGHDARRKGVVAEREVPRAVALPEEA